MLYFGPMAKAQLRMDKVPHARLPTRFGDFEIYGFENEVDGEEAAALIKGKIQKDQTALVRIHSQCFTGDTLHSLKCDCGEQLEQALAKIEAEGYGILIYQMQRLRI